MEFSKELLDRIDNESDIVSIASEFIKLERKGKNYMGLCPFHEEKTPSFSVSPEKNIARCMGCGEGGRPINFYRKIKNISFEQAVIELGEKLGIEIKVENAKPNLDTKLFELMEDALNFYKVNLNNSLSGLEVIKYLQKRNITKESISHFNLGFAPDDKDLLYQFLRSKNYSVSDMIDVGLVKRANDGTYYDFFRNRLMFPITNQFGKTVGFSARTLEKTDKNKYVNSSDNKVFNKGSILYNLNEASLEIRRKKQLIIFEGFFDVISAHQSGIKNGIATMGTSLTNEQLKLIKDLTNNVLIAYDGDKAGVSAALKIIPSLVKSGILVEVLDIPDKLDPDEFINKYGVAEFNKLVLEKSLDVYEFEYNYHIKNANINNANDIKVLIDNIKKMLEFAPPAISAIYRKKLANHLNVDESSIKIYSKETPSINAQPKKEEAKLLNKFEQSETRLLILMLRSKVWTERLVERLTVNDYSNLILYRIRAKIIEYYQNRNDFDLIEFKNMLDEEEINYFESKIQKDEYWIEQKHLEDIEIEQYIELLKLTKDYRRRSYLKNLIAEKTDDSEFIRKLTIELKEIESKLKNVKEK